MWAGVGETVLLSKTIKLSLQKGICHSAKNGSLAAIRFYANFYSIFIPVDIFTQYRAQAGLPFSLSAFSLFFHSGTLSLYLNVYNFLEIYVFPFFLCKKKSYIKVCLQLQIVDVKVWSSKPSILMRVLFFFSFSFFLGRLDILCCVDCVFVHFEGTSEEFCYLLAVGTVN